MKILVTGHLGFIGHHVVVELVRRGHAVIGVDRVQGISDKAERIMAQKPWAVVHEDADLSQYEQVANVVRKHNPAAIAHIAAQYSVKYTTENMLCYVRSNLMAPTFIFEAAKVHGVQRVVYASSVAVSDSRQPSGLYGATKGYNEDMAHAYTARSGMTAVGLRYGPTYGPLSRKDSPSYRALDEYIHEMRLSPCQLFHRAMPYLFVADAARVTVDMLLAKNLGAAHRVFTVGADDQYASLVDMVRCAQEEMGFRPRWPAKSAPMERSQKRHECDDLKAVLGYAPPTKLQQGVSETIRWMRQ